MAKPRIGFITGRQLVHRDGRWHADPGVARVVNRLAQRYPGLVMAATASEPTNLLTEAIALDPRQIHLLPEMTSITSGTRHTRACANVIRGIESNCDVTVVQLAIQAPLALLPIRGARIYHVVGDIVGMTYGSTRYHGFQRAPMVALGMGLDRLHRHLINDRRARVVTNGEMLFRHYQGRGDWVVSSTLSLQELRSETRSRPTDAPKRVLFVGYLRTEKGIDTLVDAWPAVRARFPDAELRLVGPGKTEDLGPVVSNKLQLAIRDAGVELRGSVQFGPDLFREYAEADVLALPSRSEGTPRVLIEARGLGCPVVATPVGGVPSSVEHGVDGMLVEPDDPAQLAAALINVLEDKKLSQTLIANGYARAEASTVEAFTDTLATQIDLAALDFAQTH